jgi:peptide-methionine (S)-S-oxide reductase
MRRLIPVLAGAALLIIAALAVMSRSDAETAAVVPPPVTDEANATATTEVAVLAGGCFWGVQGVLQHVAGVTSAVSGYAGGDAATAHYEKVGTSATGHAESVRITFDPRRISYGRILQIYFSVAHDPTQLNRQGPDTGPQYRSEIFPQSEEQAKVAKTYIAQLDGAHAFKQPIATKVGAVKTAFYPAEDYHQDYAVRNPYQPYIVFNDAPKVLNLKKTFPDLWREQPLTVANAGGVGG